VNSFCQSHVPSSAWSRAEFPARAEHLTNPQRAVTSWRGNDRCAGAYLITGPCRGLLVAVICLSLPAPCAFHFRSRFASYQPLSSLTRSCAITNRVDLRCDRPYGVISGTVTGPYGNASGHARYRPADLMPMRTGERGRPRARPASRTIRGRELRRPGRRYHLPPALNRQTLVTNVRRSAPLPAPLATYTVVAEAQRGSCGRAPPATSGPTPPSKGNQGEREGPGALLVPGV